MYIQNNYESLCKQITSGYVPQPIRNGTGATDQGPRDVLRDLENPNMLVPPSSDTGIIPNLKFSFSDTNMTLRPGGWSREITARELPVATTMAGVNMRLTPGGVREVHWHEQSEWSYMLKGHARITAVDDHGRNFIADIGPGDLWFFPPLFPHSIQGLADGCEFLLLFDNGNFSDLLTFSLSEFFAHYPKDVLAANFGVPEKYLNTLPTGQVYIYQGNIPGHLEDEIVQSPYGTIPESYKHRLLAQKPIITPGGSVRIADTSNFPVAKTTAAALVEIKPGGMREIHWHPNNDEFQYFISGQARMTVFADTGASRTFDYRSGDVGYVPVGYGHYVQNTGTETVWFIEAFKSDKFESISLSQMMAITPKQLIKHNLNLGGKFLDTLSLNQMQCLILPCSYQQIFSNSNSLMHDINSSIFELNHYEPN
ncbi:cupin domain-containing protein [Clostridium beijerinckii]|uniref:cupin domain-containing protein n=1 Tax=Clostridium beijerinckii TaxID=1520 RepID=UPI00098C6D31|nr:cupin domain-containing protein [Clostridium beijerinckii]MBA8934607.1 oxalate decarboxylase [Clostridium beijerinckii]NRU38792.1 oxalate decarboxylase [Clostridium beijerinckii]NSA97929.1 oxalate decarboxylase [Clostridium beijerinckii]OOM57624.1 oxalate decarboxylase OxdD [Clostridium beijerinckii]OOM67835.1 oxalate decarboxylase OxdD [Clostridium beijerinckii]